MYMSPRVEALSIVDAIATDLRNRLFEGTITVDTQLTEADVATNYDVARPTAKAAIEKLVAEGLLLRGTHKTARVPSIGPDDVHDLYFSRLCIESAVVRRLAQERRVPAAAEQANREVMDFRDKSYVNVVAPVLQFHSLLVGTLGSPRMDRLFSILMGEMRLCMVQMQSMGLMRPGDIASEHDVIIDRIKNGDADGAVEALTVHFARAQDRFVPYLEQRAQATPPSRPAARR
jgi:DNA-binding GntR family transcriptional regulator